MKKIMAFALLVLTSTLYAEIGGTYAVSGKNLQGGRYEGTCVVSGDAASGYSFSWTIGSESYTGTGTLSGDTLTVDWGAPEPVVYKVLEDGAQLKGRWGPDGKGKEKLTKQ